MKVLGTCLGKGCHKQNRIKSVDIRQGTLLEGLSHLGRSVGEWTGWGGPLISQQGSSKQFAHCTGGKQPLRTDSLFHSTTAGFSELSHLLFGFLN